MEQRVNTLEGRLSALEHQVEKLHDALLGTLDGKPGALALMQRTHEAVEHNSTKVNELLSIVGDLKLDKAKVVGVALGVSAFWGVLLAVIKFYLK